MRTETLYEQVADRVTTLIDQHTLRAGERLPSVRSLSKEWNVSITTVMQAYRVLENRGLIEARPQSGFYVLPNLRSFVPEPKTSRPAEVPCDVSISDLSVRVVMDSENPKLLNLGAAVMNPALLPARKLHRTMGVAARRWPERCVNYNMPPGTLELRTEIARRAIAGGDVLSPDDILVTNGCMEAICIALRTLAAPGDTIAVSTPTFYGHLRTIENMRLRALEIPTSFREGVDLDALEAAIREHRPAAVITVPNHHNPVGTRMTDESKARMAEIAGRYGVPIIEDDIYGELMLGDSRPRTVHSFDRSGNVILASSFSKALTGGYRIGWMVPGRRLEEARKYKMCLNYGTNPAAELGIACFLQDGGYDHHLRTLRRTLREKIYWLRNAIARHFPENTLISDPKGGFVLWVEMDPKVDTVCVYRKAVEQGISIAPGPMFSAHGQYANCMRLNAAFVGPEHEEKIEALGQIVKREIEKE